MTGASGSLRFGFIGAGAMAEALIGGLVASGVDPGRLAAADPATERRQHLRARFGVNVRETSIPVVEASDLVVLAVKPQKMDDVWEELARAPRAAIEGALWVSIAAGVTMARIRAGLGGETGGVRVVRAMPNTPALVHRGATALVADRAVDEAGRAAARELFEAVGTVWEAPEERLLDAVTGLSGSGPAYVFVLLEALADAGVRMGLPREAAHALACQTVLGAATLAIESGEQPATLKDRVTSPGGTTIAGLERLEAGGFRAALHDAVEAATRRSRELGGD